MIKRVKQLTERIEMNCMGTVFDFSVRVDPLGSRIFLQVIYRCPCTKSGNIEGFSGRKWYLSKYMTDDEIIKTAYAAFEAAVKHEVMEGFKVDGKILFNPHISFDELLKISDREVRRIPNA